MTLRDGRVTAEGSGLEYPLLLYRNAGGGHLTKERGQFVSQFCLKGKRWYLAVAFLATKSKVYAVHMTRDKECT